MLPSPICSLRGDGFPTPKPLPKQADGQRSTWGLRLDKGQYSCDLRLRGRKLGVVFECHVTLTMGLEGQIDLSILGGDMPSANVMFTAEPLIEVQTSGTKVTWGSLTVHSQPETQLVALCTACHSIRCGSCLTLAPKVPLQEQVSAEIELHALGLLRKKFNPPSVMSFPLGEAEVLFDGEDTVHIAKAFPALSDSEGLSCPPNTASLRERRDRREGGAQVEDESIGLTFVSAGHGLPFTVSAIHRGGAAERTCSLRIGDVLVAVGADNVLSAHPQVLQSLLMWPPQCNRSSRLVQLALRRNQQPVHVNLQQLQPARGSGSKREGAEESNSVRRMENVARAYKGGEERVAGVLSSGWEAGVRHEEVQVAPLGLVLEISALDGRTRIKGFFEGGPAERAELLVEGDEVCEVNGISIPVGISPACARLSRILESEGSGGGRKIPLCVKRKSAWGMQQTVRVQVQIDPASDGEDWDVICDSTSSDDCTVEGGEAGGASDLRRPPRAKTRPSSKPVVRGSRRPVMPAKGGGVGIGMSGPQMLFKELSGLVTDAFEATMPH
mmetsp:Transcript_22000/g.51172  ORF Transcript_22000/g.51172 Transcript_22000/m.51172 type:complete len:555 (+) Transcript_22000:1160-2824(+)